MQTNPSTRSVRMALLAAGALTLFATSANAQEYGDNGATTYQDGSDENIEVTVPPYRPQHDELGAPYRYLSLSKQVHFEDLDLRTEDGAQALRTRVRYTAGQLCRQLDARYPTTAPNSPPCYTNAVADAMQQADIAISDARGYAENEARF